MERVSVPRRPLDFEDYIDIVRRNFRWILGPVFAGLVIAIVVAYSLQESYISQARIRIVPQQISDNLVQNVNTQELTDHVNSMAESILSRNALSNVINTYHLYPQEMKSEPLEDVLAEMRTAINIRAATNVTSMTQSDKMSPVMQISFKYRDRYLAQKVCEDLVSRFTSQNAQETLQGQEATNQFFTDEFQRAKRTLDLVDQKLADYRTRNAGHLPEQMELNMQRMNALSQRTTVLNDAYNRNSEQRMLLESAVRIAKDRLNAIKDVTPQSQARNSKVTDLDKQIDTMQSNIANMKDRYTEDFPDLKAARQQLAVLEKQRDQALKEKPKTDTTAVENPVTARERLDAQSQLDSLQSQLKANQAESQQLSREMANASAELKSYQSRIEGVPAGEKEYADLIHDRELAKQHYDDLESKQEKSNLSMDVHRRRQGETLEVLDTANLPTEPSAPKRPLIIALGPIIGLFIGFVIVAVREMKDTSLKNLKDARLYTQLSVLGSIPLLENDLVVRKRKQTMWLGWAAATIAGLAIIAGSIVHYYLTKA